MKPRLAHILFGALLFVGLLLSTSDSYALAPSQRAERGIIETVDHPSNSFTINSGKDAVGKTYQWNNGTSFRLKSPKPDVNWISRLFSLGGKTTAESLQPGRSVRFYYRKELGRYVVRSVTMLAASDQGCGCCPRSTAAQTPTEGLPL